MTNPPKRDLPPIHSWPTRQPPRRIIHAPKGFRAWPLDLPDGLSGTDADEDLSDWMDLDPPYPVGVGIFSLPSMSLHLAAGGSLTGAVECWGPGIYLTGAGAPAAGVGVDGDYYLNVTDMEYWGPKGDHTKGSWVSTGPTALPTPQGDHTWLFGAAAPSDGTGEDGDYWFDQKNHAWYGPKADGSWASTGPHALPAPGDALISEADLLTLSSETIPPQEFTDYGLFTDTYAWSPAGGTGAFYSAWIPCGPIPAGSGFLIGSNGLYGPMGGTSLSSSASDFGAAASIACEGSIELGDAGGAVVASIPTEHHVMSYTPPSDGGSLALSQPTAQCAPVSWGDVAKARVKLNVLACSNAYTTYAAWQIGLRRLL